MLWCVSGDVTVLTLERFSRKGRGLETEEVRSRLRVRAPISSLEVGGQGWEYASNTVTR